MILQKQNKKKKQTNKQTKQKTKQKKTMNCKKVTEVKSWSSISHLKITQTICVLELFEIYFL